jgi:hypothetical protein
LRYDQGSTGVWNMPAAVEVVPKKWSAIRVLFDDGRYSVVSGIYNGRRGRVLGERWNGDSKRPLGFPNVAGCAVWHVVPRFLENPILRGLRDELARRSNSRHRQYRVEVLKELRTRA